MIKRILLLSAYVLMSASMFAQNLSVGQYNIKVCQPYGQERRQWLGSQTPENV